MIGTSDILRSVSKLEWLVYALLAGLVAWGVYHVLVGLPDAAYQRGHTAGQNVCSSAVNADTAASVADQAASSASQANADIQRSTAIGAQHEQTRTRIVTIYRTLDEEARHDTPNPVDACVLPADRLRRWSAANAGPLADTQPTDQGRASAQRDAATAATPPSDIGLDTRPGAQSPGRGPDVPRAGGTGLQPAQTHGDRAP